MEAVHSFAPLAARLAARADEIRPVDGAEATWDGFLALFICAILHMLILLCEALDARAAAVARMAAVPAPCGAGAPVILVAHSDRKAITGVRRPTRLTLVPQIQASIPKRDAILPEAIGPTPSNPRLAWTFHPGRNRAVFHLPWRPRRETSFRTPAVKHAYFVAIS